MDQFTFTSKVVDITITIHPDQLQSVGEVRKIANFLIEQLLKKMVERFGLTVMNLVHLLDLSSTQPLGRVYAARFLEQEYLANQQICEAQSEVIEGEQGPLAYLEQEVANLKADRTLNQGPMYDAIQALDLDDFKIPN